MRSLWSLIGVDSHELEAEGADALFTVVQPSQLTVYADDGVVWRERVKLINFTFWMHRVRSCGSFLLVARAAPRVVELEAVDVGAVFG